MDDRKPVHAVDSDGHELWWYPWPITPETVRQVKDGAVLEDISGNGHHGLLQSGGVVAFDHVLPTEQLESMAKDPLGMFKQRRR